MNIVGIESMNFYAGSACIDVYRLAELRKLDMSRFENLLMKEKTVPMLFEDPVTYAVNAAKPIVDALSEEQKNRIEMVITCTESSFDFGKSMSTYCHDLLGLNRNCRLFELKGACYSGVAGLQNACNFVLSNVSPGAKALVIATDISRFIVEENGDDLEIDWSFAEPTGGAGAVAMLVSDNPHVFQLDVGASGYYGYEVMDTCRPSPDTEAGDSDLSLLSYLDCAENAFRNYQERVEGADYAETFAYLAFHCPFGGMVKGAHRNVMRKFYKANPKDIEEDFQRRVAPGLTYCQRVGNIMGATACLSLIGTIANGSFETPQRVGIFSYGSGCCSEFFSGVVTKESKRRIAALDPGVGLDRRYQLSMDEYENVLKKSGELKFGTRNLEVDLAFLPQSRSASSTLYLKRIKEFHREYEWANG